MEVACINLRGFTSAVCSIYGDIVKIVRVVIFLFVCTLQAFRHHHLHHAIVWGNYAPFLSWLDKVIGTEILLEDEAGRLGGWAAGRLFRNMACTTCLTDVLGIFALDVFLLDSHKVLMRRDRSQNILVDTRPTLKAIPHSQARRAGLYFETLT